MHAILFKTKINFMQSKIDLDANMSSFPVVRPLDRHDLLKIEKQDIFEYEMRRQNVEEFILSFL